MMLAEEAEYILEVIPWHNIDAVFFYTTSALSSIVDKSQ